jgi:hypothetical protein
MSHPQLFQKLAKQLPIPPKGDSDKIFEMGAEKNVPFFSAPISKIL